MKKSNIILSLTCVLCLWIGLWSYCKECKPVQNIAFVVGLLSMTVLEAILISERWKYMEHSVNNADKSYKSAHKNDDYLDKVSQMFFIEKNVYTLTFVLIDGMAMVCEAALAAYLGWKYGRLFFIEKVGMVLVFLQEFGVFYTLHCVVESFVVGRKIRALLNISKQHEI